MDPRKLERLLLVLKRNGVTRYATPDITLELGGPRPEPPGARQRVDPKDPKSVDDFLRARLAPSRGSS